MTHRFNKWIRSIRVVFSIDLTSTRVFEVMGEFVSLRGLKLSTAFRMRLDVDGLVRTSTERVFKVASTIKASLKRVKEGLSAKARGRSFPQ